MIHLPHPSLPHPSLLHPQLPHLPARTHEHRETRLIDILFPDHERRVNSQEHRDVRRELIEERRFGCYICGRTIADFGGDASQLEIHHLFAEYAEYLNIDPARVRADHPVLAPYNREGSYDGVDAKCGSLVLCALHHRGSDAPGRALEEGVHHSGFEEWLMQKFVADDHLHRYFPGVILVRRGVADEGGYLPAFLATRPELAAELREIDLLPAVLKTNPLPPPAPAGALKPKRAAARR